jgi:hypothetical protein
MNRTLSENIAPGHLAITLARQLGVDTTAWEQALAELERRELLSWATELAEQEVVLPKPLTYLEASLRTITTERVSHYAAVYLRAISLAYSNKRTGGWGSLTQDWWQRQEKETIQALLALRRAMRARHARIPNHERRWCSSSTARRPSGRGRCDSDPGAPTTYGQAGAFRYR